MSVKKVTMHSKQKFIIFALFIGECYGYLKVRTEAGRKLFLFQGSKLYNQLPDALKQERSIMNFKRKCEQLDNELNF